MSHFQKITTTGKLAKTTSKTHVAVIDQRTGLMWTAEDVGTATFRTAPNLIADLNARSFAGFNDWRLPTAEELFALADRSRFNRAIDTAAFPACKGGWYWSSTVYASPPSGYAWVVSFRYGRAFYGHQNSPGRVRAVRSVSAASAGQ